MDSAVGGVCGHARQLSLQDRPHLVDGLHRDHGCPRRDEERGQLSGSRREVEHRAPRLQPELAPQARDRLGRVRGPAQLVRLRRAREALGRRLLDPHAHPGSVGAGTEVMMAR